MKSFKSFIKENMGVDVADFADIISKMSKQPGYHGHEIVGDEIIFSFDTDGNADIAYSNVDAEELEHMEVGDDPYEDLKDIDYENLGNDDHIDDFDDSDYDDEPLDESISNYTRINEAKIIVKVNSKGQKRRRVKCKRGFKLNPKGTACVPIAGREKANKKIAIRKSVRTKKAQGAGYASKTKRRRNKALRKRKAMGL